MIRKIISVLVGILVVLVMSSGPGWAATSSTAGTAEAPGTSFVKVLNASVSGLYRSSQFDKDSTAFAVTDTSGTSQNSLYRSQDGGKTWILDKLVIDGSQLNDVNTFVIDELSPLSDELFLRGHYSDTSKQLLLVSQDNGDHWKTLVVKDDPDDSSTDSNIIPAHIVSAGTDTLLGITTDNDVLVASDSGGTSWNYTLKSDTVAVAPLDKSRFFAISKEGAVSYSSDAGKTWTQTGLSLNPAPGLALTDAVRAVTDSTGFTAVAVSSNDSAGLEIARGSSDRWTKADPAEFRATGAASPSRAYCADLVSGGAIFAGTPDHAVLVSEDYGASWKAISIADEVDQILCAPWGDNLVVLTASNAGIYRLVYQAGASQSTSQQAGQTQQTGQSQQQAAPTISFTVGDTSFTVGGSVYSSDAAPFIAGGRTYVPVRYLSDALGATTYWDDRIQEAVVVKDSTKVTLIIGKQLIIVNGQSSPMDAAPLLQDGRVYLPARYVAEAFGYTVSWNQATQAVTISAKQSSS